MAKKAATKDPDVELVAALTKILDGESRPLQGTPASGAIFPGGAKGTPLLESAISREFIEVVTAPVPGKPAKGKAAPPKYGRITEKGRQWIIAKGSPLAVAESLRDSLSAQGTALNGTLHDTQTTLARLGEDITRLQQTLKEQVDRYQQAANALRNVLEQAKGGGTHVASWFEDAVEFVANRKRLNAMTRPTLPQLYDELKSKYPNLTLAQFHDGLRTLHNQRRIKLGAYTQALATIPDLQNALYLDQEVKFYVELA